MKLSLKSDWNVQTWHFFHKHEVVGLGSNAKCLVPMAMLLPCGSVDFKPGMRVKSIFCSCIPPSAMLHKPMLFQNLQGFLNAFPHPIIVWTSPMPLYPSRLSLPCLYLLWNTPFGILISVSTPWDSALFGLECGLGIHIVIQWYHACSFIFIYALSVGGRRWSCSRTLGMHSLFHQPLFYSLLVAVQSEHAGSSTQVNTETWQLEVMLTPEGRGESMRIEWPSGWWGDCLGKWYLRKGW